MGVRIFKLVGLVAVVVAVAVAGASARSTSSGAVTGSITFMSITSTQAADKKLIEDFEHLYPGVTVNATWLAGATGLFPALTTQFQAGHGPDVFVIYSGSGVNPSVTSFAQAGNLQDLSSSPWVKRIPASIKPLTLVNKKPYMWMMGVQPGMIVYNTAEFTRLGLKVPKTWAQMLSLCGAIQQKAPGKIPLSFSGGAASTAAPNLVQFASQDVYGKDPAWNTKRLAGKTSFAATPGWKNAFQRILDLKNASCFGPGVAGDQLAASQAQFASGQSLMMIGPAFITATIEQLSPNLKYSEFVPPGRTAAATRMTIYPSQGLAVNSKSTNMEAARAFVNYAARQAPNNQWARLNGVMAPWDYQKKLLPPQYKPLVPYVDTAIAGFYLPWPTGTTFAAVGTSVQGLLTGQKTVDQVLADLDATWGK